MSRPRSPRCRLLLQSPSLASVPGPLLRLEWPSVVGGVGRGSFCCLLWPFSCPSTVGCEERVTGQMAAAAGRASAGQPGRCSVRVGPGRGAGSCPRSFAPGPCEQCGPLACARKRPRRPASGRHPHPHRRREPGRPGARGLEACGPALENRRLRSSDCPACTGVARAFSSSCRRRRAGRGLAWLCFL